MWSSTNQRIKALMSARQREKERLTRPIHVRRADIKLSFRNDEGFLVEVPARALLNDFTPAGFSIYAVSRLTPNVELTIELDHPKHFRLIGKVVWCQYQPSSSHVLTAPTYPYRVGLAFIWKDAALEEEFKKFCADLVELYVNKKGLFIEENFVSATPPVEAAPAELAKDPNDVPPPKESDEGGAPTDEKVAEAVQAAPAAPTGTPTDGAPAAATETPAVAAAPAAPVGETASVLDALKDIDPAAPAAAAPAEEKKAA
jgi:hypothetical protein